MPSALETEPVFWTSTKPNANREDRERFSMVNGKRVREKVPQVGHVGEYDNYHRARNSRYDRMIRHDGHEVFVVFTNAAAHLNPNDGYGQYVKLKSRSLGWYLAGECPCALVAARTISAGTIVSDEVRAGQPCNPNEYSPQKPCPHAIAEREARRAQHEALMREKRESAKSDQTLMLEIQRKALEQQGETLKVLMEQATAPAAKPHRKVSEPKDE